VDIQQHDVGRLFLLDEIHKAVGEL
jgi:hypothetical protein